MKKITSFLISLSVLCTIFSGCTDNASDAEAAVQPALPAAVTDENYNRLQTITVFGVRTGCAVRLGHSHS